MILYSGIAQIEVSVEGCLLSRRVIVKVKMIPREEAELRSTLWELPVLPSRTPN